MTYPTYSLDIFVHRARKLVIMVRRASPYTDEHGVYHQGTQAGINVWFSKARYARSGKESATISANTATSHALNFTKPDDWEPHIDYLSGITREKINDVRREAAKEFAKAGYTFVGMADHKLGERLGLEKPKKATLKRLVRQLTMKQLHQRIDNMTRFVPEGKELTQVERNRLVNRCIRDDQYVDEPIITISDLFDEVCSLVEEKEDTYLVKHYTMDHETNTAE